MTEPRTRAAATRPGVDGLERRREVGRKPIRTIEAIVDRLCSREPAARITRKQVFPIRYLGYLACRGIGESEPSENLGGGKIIHTRCRVHKVQRHRRIVVNQKV